MKMSFVVLHTMLAPYKYLDVAAVTYLSLAVMVSMVLPHFVLYVVHLIEANPKNLAVAAVRTYFRSAVVDLYSKSSQMLEHTVLGFAVQ